jgi:hypothetical protein
MTEAYGQWWTLVRRGLAIKRKDTWNTVLLMAQAPIIAGLIVLVFGKPAAQAVTPQTWSAVTTATATTVFLMALSALWFGCSNSAREIVGEWAVYRRERMVNLNLFSYLASKLTVLGGLCAIQCAVLLGMVYWGNGLAANWFLLYGILLLVAATGVAIGLLVSAIARSSEVAIAALPVVILPMVILGGILHPGHEMNSAARAVAQAMPSRWAFEALLLVEANKRPTWEASPQTSAEPAGDRQTPQDVAQEPSPLRQDMAERFFPADSHRVGVAASLVALVSMLVILTSSIGIVLRSRDER